MAELPATAGANGAAAPDQQTAAQLALQRIYLKDASFESPGAPQVFGEEGQPQLGLNMAQKVTNLGNDQYEVVLSVTLTCKLNDKTAYLAEAHQAGLFALQGFEQRAMEVVLATYCPNVLFPYVRQTITELVQSGGFPPYLLQPINFEQLYAEQLKRRSQADATQVQTPAVDA